MDIWTVNVAGGEPELLADIKLDSPSLAWSGDGERLFVLAESGLFVIEVEDGSGSTIGDGTYHGQVAWLAEK